LKQERKIENIKYLIFVKSPFPDFHFMSFRLIVFIVHQAMENHVVLLIGDSMGVEREIEWSEY
jgi:hypothetical protein